MVAATLVPAADANGAGFENAHPMPGCGSTMAQSSATGPVNPLSPFTTIVSVMFVPTLVEMFGEFAVTEKSFTESVTLVERVRLLSAELTPRIATVAFAAGVVPNVVCSVTTDWFPGVTFGVTVAGTGVQVTPAGSAPHPTAISSVILPSGV